jgi:hypothetical protein
MTATAVCMAASGIALLFASDDLVRSRSDPRIPQLLGGALLGFAAINWTARGSTLGGIYGRAVVVGNQTHLTIGALLLMGRGFESVSPAWWAVAALYVLGAGYFTYLTFFSSGIATRS